MLTIRQPCGVSNHAFGPSFFQTQLYSTCACTVCFSLNHTKETTNRPIFVFTPILDLQYMYIYRRVLCGKYIHTCDDSCVKITDMTACTLMMSSCSYKYLGILSTPLYNDEKLFLIVKETDPCRCYSTPQ